MESRSSQWQSRIRPPWIVRVAGGHSPSSSGAESDTESSTGSEKVSREAVMLRSGSSLWGWSFLRQFTISESHYVSRLNCLWFQSLTCGDIVCFFQSCIKKLEAGSPRSLPSPSVIQRRITDIDQKKEELKIEVGMFGLLRVKRKHTVVSWHSSGFNKDQVEGLIELKKKDTKPEYELSFEYICSQTEGQDEAHASSWPLPQSLWKNSYLRLAQRLVNMIQPRLSLLVIQLQLEIALLQGELQTEKTQLHRQTQRLQALKEAGRRTEKSRHSDREKVNLRVVL